MSWICPGIRFLRYVVEFLPTLAVNDLLKVDKDARPYIQAIIETEVDVSPECHRNRPLSLRVETGRP